MLFSPVLRQALQALGAAVRHETDLTQREREIAILIVAAHWSRANTQLDRSTIVELSTLVGYYAPLALQLRVFRVD